MKKILLIEDNPLNMKFIRRVLESAGYRALTAPDALTGLELAFDERPALVLMDIQLPGMDGLEATRLLKGDPRTAHIPVVLLTAFAMDTDEQRGLLAGAEAYVTKPVRYKNLLEVIEGFVGVGANDEP